MRTETVYDYDGIIDERDVNEIPDGVIEDLKLELDRIKAMSNMACYKEFELFKDDAKADVIESMKPDGMNGEEYIDELVERGIISENQRKLLLTY